MQFALFFSIAQTTELSRIKTEEKGIFHCDQEPERLEEVMMRTRKSSSQRDFRI